MLLCTVSAQCGEGRGENRTRWEGQDSHGPIKRQAGFRWLGVVPGGLLAAWDERRAGAEGEETKNALVEIEVESRINLGSS